MHRIALGIDCGIVVHRCTEDRNHPFVDVVESVVTQPVGEPSSRHRGRETIGLGFGPHGHVSAVAVSLDTESLVVYRILFRERVYSRHDVPVIATAKIPYVSLYERFTQAVTAPRI